MVNCHMILELYLEEVSQSTISSTTGYSRKTVSLDYGQGKVYHR
ncbi:hypothetical protein [Radiobacillus kanasensis]|nr:hypothetical protein [Radiobacillus kanasensis]